MNSTFELEHKINEHVQHDNGCTVHFEHTESVDGYRLNTYTYNPKTKETFLLLRIDGDTLNNCLNKTYEYLVGLGKDNNSYTVTWKRKGEAVNSQTSSYFYCHDMLQVLSKFFDKKNPNDYVIYEIKLNAIS